MMVGVIVGGKMEYTYNWLHIPTGNTGTRTQTFSSYKDFLEQLNNWNRSRSPDNYTWKYWV